MYFPLFWSKVYVHTTFSELIYTAQTVEGHDVSVVSFVINWPIVSYAAVLASRH